MRDGGSGFGDSRRDRNDHPLCGNLGGWEGGIDR